MKYLSVCSGIEAATVAWKPLGWQAVGFSEIEKFPSKVLEHHYPNVTNYGDMTKFKEWNIEKPDVLVGGTPCQSFSVAGLRKGLDDPRGNLMLTYVAIAKRFKPKWLVWENVPGVLSSNEGRDFGTLLTALAECGYGFAYSILDAQYFGLAQRRKRVFVVGCLGDWRSAAAVLFERESLSGNPEPSREAREETSKESGIIVNGGGEVSKCLTARGGQAYDSDTDNFVSYGIPGNWIGRKPENGGNQVKPFIEQQPCQTKTDRHAVAAFKFHQGSAAGGIGYKDENSPTLAGEKPPAITSNKSQVRRLTPTECERLQGFPDGYTDIQPNGKQTPDGPRYKALGNSMAVPVMRWIGERINLVEEVTNGKHNQNQSA